MFASRMLFLLNIPFSMPVAIIAPGIPADIVIPTFNPRYVLAAAKRQANIIPNIIE